MAKEILVVDDNTDIRKLISGILKEDKYSGNYEPQIIIKDLMLLN